MLLSAGVTEEVYRQTKNRGAAEPTESELALQTVSVLEIFIKQVHASMPRASFVVLTKLCRF